MSYLLKVYRCHPYYRGGNLDAQDEMIHADVFKTKKAAKEWIESRIKQVHRSDKVHQKWKTGNESSYVWVEGKKTWTNENSGEEEREVWTYEVIKK